MTAPFTLIRVADCETSAMDDPAELVEIGWTDLMLAPDGWGIALAPKARLVNPGMPITFGAMAAHHISQAEAETGMNPDEARALLLDGADIIATHNWIFDQRFIRTPADKPIICTLKCSRYAWPEMQSHSNGAIRYERGLCLDDPRAYPPHRAGPDSWITAHVLLDLLKVLSVEEMIEISSKPLLQRICDLKKHKGTPWSEIPRDYLDWILTKSDMPSDPTKEDIVHTARVEVQRRAAIDNAAAASFGAPATPVADNPDAWRETVAKPAIPELF